MKASFQPDHTPPLREPVELRVPGVRGWTTTRHAGSYGLGAGEGKAPDDVVGRWRRMESELRASGIRGIVSSRQVHGAVVKEIPEGVDGWLHLEGFDGFVCSSPGVAIAVTVADCTPVFIASRDGPVALLHAGWRGTAQGILEEGLAMLAALGVDAGSCSVHLGAAICGSCYEVGEELLRHFSALAVRSARPGKGFLDVRAELAERAYRAGVESVTVSDRCTRCDNDMFFSHRAGDDGRQLAVIVRTAVCTRQLS